MQRRSVTGSEKDLGDRGHTPPRDRTPPRQSWAGPSSSRVRNIAGDSVSIGRPSMIRTTTPPRNMAEHAEATVDVGVGVVGSHAAERGSRVWRGSNGGAFGL